MSRAGAALAAIALVVVTASTGTAVTAAPQGSEAVAAEAATSIVGAQTGRLAGSDRYGSSVAVSRHRYADPAQAEVVYLAHGEIFADALAAGTLSDGPVLLTTPDCRALPPVVRAEIERLDPARVVALGGPAAVCEEVLVDAAGDRPTDRVGGADRQETAALIAVRAFPDGADRVYLTRGSTGPDSVVGGMLDDGPILMTSGDGTLVPEATAQAISDLHPATVVALGGEAAVTSAALRDAADGRPTGRLAGPDRYATAVAIARYAYPGQTGRVYLARGDEANFVDAVASGALTDGPVLLTPGSCAPVRASTAAELERRRPSRVVALGGTAALCEPTLRGAALDTRPPVDCASTSCVAVTFDDGPGPLTDEVLDIFASERVPATFFVVGHRLLTWGEVARHTWIAGHEVGNHTFDHLKLPDLTRAQQQDQVDRTDAALRALGVPTPTLMRPPFLSFNTDTRRLGKAVILTDVNAKDWSGRSPEEIRTFIRENARSGSVVILHDTVSNTVTALPGVLADLKAAGHTLVTVPELLPDLEPGDLVYNRATVYDGASTGITSEDTVTLDDGRVLAPLEGGTGPLDG